MGLSLSQSLFNLSSSGQRRAKLDNFKYTYFPVYLTGSMEPQNVKNVRVYESGDRVLISHLTGKSGIEMLAIIIIIIYIKLKMNEFK